MRPAPILAALALAFAAAGCSSPAATDSLDAVFPDLQAGNATSGPERILGSHLEGSIADGPWGATANVTLESGNVTGPRMGTASALGGGGELTALSLPGNATVSVRIVEHARLAGYFARFTLADGSGNATPAETGPATDTFHARLIHPGPFTVTVQLYSAASNATPAATFAETFQGRLAYHWKITGDVQPQKKQDVTGADPWPTARDQMVDKYSLQIPEGAPVVALSAFDGTYTPGDGVDIDLGLYSADGTGVACAAGTSVSAGSTPNNPAQAAETLTAATDAAGLWTVEIGAMQDGCPVNGGAGGVFSYTNAGPVPYTLEITAG